MSESTQVGHATPSATNAFSALKWGFSTLGCPNLTLQQVCELANAHRVDHVELRALADELDLPKYLREAFGSPAEIQQVLREAGVHVVSLDASFKLIGSGPEDRAALLDFTKWAEALEVPYIRVFGGGSMDAPLTSGELHEACRNVQWWARQREAQGWQSQLILETHDGFSSSERCLTLDERAPGCFGVLWDTHHTWKLGGEPVDVSWARMGHLVKHVHIKDSVSEPTARHPYTYVLPGTGEFPALDTLRVLESSGYDGIVCLEWERKWHPYLPPIADALEACRSAGWRP